MPDEFTILEATPDDVLRLREIDEATGRAVGKSHSDYLGALSEPLQRKVLHIRSSKEIAGFLVARGAAQEWELENIIVRPSYRRLGLGERLLRHLISLLDGKATAIHLEVRASNAAAISLYRKLGFREDGIRKAYYSNPIEDALLFSLSLQKSS